MSIFYNHVDDDIPYFVEKLTMKIIIRICAFVVIAIGIIHIGFGFLNFKELSPDALWFCGSGLAMIFLGFINLLMDRHPTDKWHSSFALISNALFVVFVAVMNIVMLMVPGVITLIAVFILLTLGILKRKEIRSIE